MTTVHIGLGSNVQAEKNLRAAAASLKKSFPGIRFSPVYRSAPMHKRDQADFLNAAAVFETDLSPKKAQKILQAIEKKLKKNPPERFGPRTIDLDLLLYGQEILLDDALTVPHLAMHLRKFVLQPLVDLGAGEVPHPGFDRTIEFYLQKVARQDCEKTDIRL